MTSVIYPGTFDPITNGHLDIIERSAVIFPRVLVAVANSPSKKPLFSLEERVELVRQSVAHLSNVEVFGFSDLLANVIKQHNISAIIRGVRTTTDFEYELQLAALNRLLTKGVDSLFFPPAEKWAFVSSTIVREIYLHGGDVAELVPEPVFNALKAR
ncbi:pantetheine-phosphate adenylyltransferase [Haemophilus influenzae]|jgi:pantetheine-phosphate adenylyltransferase, bacterial|uniref:Phosphopantetheine adenylyltransferase n=3 Tax=Haemophilus influenzae TaxID=727 RepID=COAD_HAEI8|nr:MULTISPECIES: pantetheine-phosphate adenylyltransferase [Haemophilus]Q4QMR6.1 RecName: Full=Phosphopantetheine adenylyltransferase; AltName: Full=Dephospho-CoA pyrophosphorylase; AltName: Full=Pantetheine-phosphate adenylyltransferase; Short=PPAT [Haemophilus influenzae 86-028NP]AAX87681.1 phosphopantetheine adenylyltransferase [Haemophilus influenzae 86-028NP]AIT67011.1 phosphopantetheine adenylyltransferase [Haemophilus influenzae]AJO89104.1 Phosphopantetheine adenylyltransferase [Haemophi